MKLNTLKDVISEKYMKAGAFATTTVMSVQSFADTDNILGESKRGASKAGDSIGDIKDRGVSGMNTFMEVMQYVCIVAAFLFFVLAVLDLTKLNKQGSDVTPMKILIKFIVAVVLAGATYFFWSASNSAAGNV
ncbi:hypothetical protein [Acinetobacter sp. Marseille-Q1618]|uniref:hypothetical protein n=1 Tax=Acinetobacter sp. Marseille-Q1618 TaxID=2697502 RepID=UPI00156D80C6|nr:hypothetical protein [Acinetobacter sp. Marseille-Q1618]